MLPSCVTRVFLASAPSCDCVVASDIVLASRPKCCHFFSCVASLGEEESFLPSTRLVGETSGVVAHVSRVVPETPLFSASLMEIYLSNFSYIESLRIPRKSNYFCVSLNSSSGISSSPKKIQKHEKHILGHPEFRKCLKSIYRFFFGAMNSTRPKIEIVPH